MCLCVQKMSNTASQKKADASLEAMRNAAKLAAETPMAAESPEVRVSLFGGTPRGAFAFTRCCFCSTTCSLDWTSLVSSSYSCCTQVLGSSLFSVPFLKDGSMVWSYHPECSACDLLRLPRCCNFIILAWCQYDSKLYSGSFHPVESFKVGYLSKCGSAAGGNRAVLETARTLHLKEEERRNNRNFWLSIVFQARSLPS